MGEAMRIGFIGFGEAGYGLAKGMRQSGLEHVYFVDNNWNTPPYGDVIMKHAAETGAVLLNRLEELLAASDIIISCVTGAVAIVVAKNSASFLGRKHLYIDVNTASPEVMEHVAEIVEKTGAAFADIAMMGAVPAFLHRVPILASGRGALKFKDMMRPYDMNITCVGDRPGQASAIKMFRSIFMKGFFALLLETLNATHRFKVDDIVLASISETMERMSFLETVRLQVAKGVISAERMAHEMKDVVETLKDINVSTVMATATGEKLSWCSRLGLKEHFGGKMPESLNEILDVIEDKSAIISDGR